MDRGHNEKMHPGDLTDVNGGASTDAVVEDLPAGARIGQYRLDGVLGRGGMGVVYRATDTKLGRPVAIKFIAVAGADAQAKRRFAQEAETASALNHPHIVTVHDVGEHDGRAYIVSELVDGGTLDAWSAATRRRTWRHSVELLTGVADGIAAAHAAGVLHRDIKPGNILIGSNGYAKLADFGLAKLLDKGPRDPRTSNASRDTRAGVVIGTVAYMSPEQASGQAVDTRSDVFSFGLVLHELIAGRRTFEGANDLETLKSIVHAQPTPLPDDVPEALRGAVEKCLEKDPAERYQSMRDLVVDLKRVARKSGSSPSVPAAPAARRGASWPLVAGLVIASLAIVPAALYFMRPPQTVAPRMHFEIPAPGYVAGGSNGGNIAISLDGQTIAYVSDAGGSRQIWLRPIGEVEPRALRGTEGAGDLFWAADGRSLGFSAGGQLKRIDARGGTAQVVASTAASLGAGAWYGDDTILFTMPDGDAQFVIARVPAAGGSATPVTTHGADDDDRVHAVPVVTDDAFVYMATTVAGQGTLRARSLESGVDAALPIGFAGGGDFPGGLAYTDGLLLYTRGERLIAHRFDADSLALNEEPMTVAENVDEFAVADSALVYVERAEATTPARRLVWFDRAGTRLDEVVGPPGAILPALSPDGQRVLVTVAADGRPPDLWTIDLARGVNTPLTFDAGLELVGAWSPDGSRVAYAMAGNIASDIPGRIAERAANGTGSERILHTASDDAIVIPTSWSADGRYLFFHRFSVFASDLRTGSATIWVLDMTAEGGEAEPLLESQFAQTGTQLSPDGRWVAYNTNESGEMQIVVRPFPEVTQGKWQVSVRGGANPRWRGDGRELFYLAPDGMIMAVAVTPGETFEFGPPRALFDSGLATALANRELDIFLNVTPDGERFLITQPVLAPGDAAEPPAASIHVIVNWRAALAEEQ
jgi:Tol biopolymer transport system component/predicted Ser/Thr protein kinase